MKLIIGISGKAQHGKDSFAKFLNLHFSKHVPDIIIRRICFADRLKTFVSDLLDVGDWYVNDDIGKAAPIKHMNNITGREALQVVGTDIARKISPDIWVFHYDQVIQKWTNDGRDFIILTPDMRFENEYNYIKNTRKLFNNVDSATIRVIRPNFSIGKGSEHLSETALDNVNNWDFIIEQEYLDGLEEAAINVVNLMLYENGAKNV